MIYESLPEQIRKIIPKEKIVFIRRIKDNMIKVALRDDGVWDTWIRRDNGRWSCVNRG